MSAERYFWVYILASDIGGTLYIGVTNNLIRRVYEHRNNVVPGFTNKYAVHRLVWRLKKWNRAWKIRLIEQSNPNWDDLYPVTDSP